MAPECGDGDYVTRIATSRNRRKHSESTIRLVDNRAVNAHNDGHYRTTVSDNSGIMNERVRTQACNSGLNLSLSILV